MALIDFGPAKSARNERGIAFERFADMDFDTAVAIEDSARITANNDCACWAGSTASFTPQ